ncbi:MAG: hypothetical protein JWO12_1892 [Frankiales bacterium]|nr:hypothetical protein [Frankiales bacterium]
MTPSALGLSAHPEGGWYRETHRSPESVHTVHGERAAFTSILYLLEPGQSSAWHRVRSAELWVWQGGGPLRLSLGGSAARPALDTTIELGPEGVLQHVVRPGVWQAASPAADATVLLGCVVVPGFDFDDFELET